MSGAISEGYAGVTRILTDRNKTTLPHVFASARWVQDDARSAWSLMASGQLDAAEGCIAAAAWHLDNMRTALTKLRTDATAGQAAFGFTDK
jgi:hypothetical protein